MRWFALLASVVLLAVGCGGSDTQEVEATGTIAFTRGEHIWLMSADGSAQRRLTRGSGPAWSPDGRRIAFSVDGPDNSSQIFVIGADGRGRLRLTRRQFTYDKHFSPVWSPDGGTIAFQRYDDGDYWISVVGADGTGQRTLTPGNGRPEDAQPAWSPDGRTIAFTNVHDNAVYATRPDGSGRRVLLEAHGDSRACCVAWSPDGRRLAVVRDDFLWVMNADGTELRSLVESFASGIAWSPDGERIAFASGDIFVVNADGTSPLQVADDVVDVIYDRGQVWSPDGQAIAFTSDREGDAEIYVVDADGSDQRNVSNHPGEDSEPAWSPTS